MLSFILVMLAIGGAFLLSHPGVKGKIGEFWIGRYLRDLDQNEYKVFHNLLIERKNGKTSQIDHVIVSPYGIFVIETKNFKGWIFGSEKSQYWTQVIYKRKHKFYNPIHQNYGHIKVIEEVLREKIDVPIISIIAFSQRATLKSIDVQADNVKVIYDKDIVRTIEQYSEIVINKLQFRGIVELLSVNKIEEKGANREHIAQVKQMQQEAAVSVEAGICPKCGGELVVRTGKRGRFTGCSGFPRCRFIVTK